jgi:hypothetical protein
MSRVLIPLALQTNATSALIGMAIKADFHSVRGNFKFNNITFRSKISTSWKFRRMPTAISRAC